MFFAQPKCASTRFRSWVANAIFMLPPPCSLPLRLMSRKRRMGIIRRLARSAPTFGARLVRVGDEDVADIEDQVARCAIADRHLMSCTQPVEGRDAEPKERDAKPVGRLASVRM